MIKYEKSYKTKEEYELRFFHFQENLKHIKENNKKNSFILEINEYSDWTDSEYKIISGQFENREKKKPRVMSKKPLLL